ncbi:WDR59/RTC1-like RING zinc finger domain-containing protein [Caenorhabditis elegans]|nr:GATOR complex protein WDR24 [Caenorhabditis elegans]VGM69504.1 GATOR complex protein WDR24 [Caenorhabditis elegans]
MEEPDPNNVFKKPSPEILFAEYGRSSTEGESHFKDPTPENKRVIDLYDPVDAMSLNREKDRVVVSGIRGVLQIIKIQNSTNDLIEGPSIVKDLDMRVYRKGKVNILYSAQNVKWNQLYDQYIATTSSNGSIVCWNISRRNKSVFKSHERSATCLDWHATTPYILVSGSRDCTVKSYDMRVKDNHQLTFSDRNCESIRDVAMCKAPGFDDYFFTGDDGGVLRLWDLRQTRRWVFQKVAHRSFVSTLSLNPHNRTLIATGGGRDKMVKIWEWTGPELNRISVVETTAPLGRVAWRPDRPYHLATCASVNETSVHVWDVRRPYLPYVTYDEHRDSVTDACWPSTDFDVFMTCGKDGLVVLHNIDSGHAPISFACDVAFDITPDGTMGLAVNSEIHAKNDADLEAKMCGPKSKKAIRQIPYESFFKPIKSLVSFGVPESLTHSLPPTTFYKIAEKYLIGGVEIMQLCETNSKVARKNGLEHVAQTWRLVEALCEQAHIQEEYDRLSAEEKERVIRAWVVRKKELAEEGRRWLANLNDHYRDDVKKQVTQRLENTQHVTAFLKFSSSSESEEGSDNEKIGDGDNDRREIDKMAPDVNRNTAKKKKKKKKAIAATDFYFGAGEANFKGGKQEILHYNEFMGLRDEAYELRDEEKERRFFCKAKKQPTNDEEYEELHRELNDTEADFQAWSPMLEIYRLLLYHAEQGDMQTCAAISMVCGKRLLDAVDPYTVNGWIQCYMEMLHRLELFLVCAKIRKYCPLDSISSVSRENTTIQLAHADCDALIVNGRCTKCEALAQADCTVCRFGIVGMTFQCNVCGHCMHTDHAYQWFQKTKECAFVGCPCTCGQNTWPDMERTFIGNDEIRKGHRKFNHLEQTEPTTNRVDASRLDTDSEESPEEDIEWSTATKLIRDKFGEVPCDDWDTPWAKHLVDIYKERLRKPGDFVPKRILALTEPPVASEDDGEEEDPAAFSSKEIAEAEVRDSLFSQLQDVITEQHDNIKGTSEDEVEDREDEDRTDLVKYYLNPPPPPKNEVRVQEEQLEGSRKRKLEQIQEEDEDEEILDEEEELFEEEEEVDEEYEGEVEEVHRESSEELDDEEEEEEVMPEEEIEEDQEDEQESVLDESEEDKDEPWDENLFGDNYIKSIGPIGLQWDLKLENERVTSPTFLSAVVKEHLMDVKRFTFAGSSDEEHQEAEEEEQEESRKVDERALLNATPEKPTEREGEVLKAPAQLTYAQKALMILGMSRSELKKKKARKQNKQLAELARKMTTEKKSFYSIDVSSDEFHVSSLSDDSFSKSTRSSSSSSSSSEFFVPRAAALEVSETKICEGYNPEIERSLSADEEEESTSHDELSAQPELRLPTPHATGDLYLKRDSPSPEIVHKMKKFKKKCPPMDSDMFSSEEDLFESCQEDLNVPFFPETEDVPIIPGTRHPWETDQVYQQRLQAERAEDEAAHVVPVSEEKEKAEEVEDPIVPPVEFNKHTPMMRELAKRRRKLKLQYPKPLQPLKRVKFTEQDYDTSMKAALENLKLEAPEMSSESDFEDFVREQEVCRKCKHQVKRDKMEKQYANWLRNVTDEGQMFFAKSLSDPCAKFQLSHLDSYRTDAEKARKTAVHLLEFIKVFYFIKWEELLGPDREFVLKEVYELWEDYREKRPRICRLHFKDYQFRFFASSIATKMKEEMLRGESPQLRQSLLNYDWLHIKPCVTTIDDDPHAMDEMLDTIVLRNPNWSIEEKKAANRYWDLFGKIPLHIESSTAVVVPPLSEDQLEIIDESNYWTKKQMKQVLCRKRNYDIRLGYTRQKKNNGDLFRVQDRSRKVVNREWQMRLEKMVNETRRVDFSTSSFRVNPHEKLIYTSDEHHPWPVCQFDNGDHYVTVQPMASKRYIEFKSRIRSKFHFRRQSSLIDNSKDVEITTEKLRKLPSFKKFEPRLQKATDFKEMVSKHFKVLDRAIVKSRYELYTIMEEDDEVELIVNMLENRTVKHGKRRLDAEDIFAERRSQRERKEREAYGRMTGAKYRRELANTEKQEIEKMKIMNKHWMPALRKKIRIARKVIEIGRLMVEEDVRKWMEYQYEMTFVKKMFRKKSLVTKKDLKYSAPVVWRDAIYQLDYKEPTIIPPYVKPLTKLNEYHYKELPIYNSSSDDEDYDPDDDRPSDDSFIQFETQPDLPAVAASLQNEIRENLELADEQADEQWEYSDDSSVSTWFNDGTDDILNRLINSDYLEEHMILKERARGALGWKLCNVLKEREPLDSESDEEENESFEYMVQTDLQKQIDAEDQWMEENAVLQDVGITDGKRTKQLAKLEHDQDMKRMERREDHQKEAQQVRWFLKKFALDHSYMTEPYTWHEDLHSAISSLHRSELRRVSNRVHLIMKSEYEELAEHDEMIADIIPRDETSIQYKMINFLLFRSNGESFEESSRRADECRDMIKPVQQYELFFGREGTYTLNMVQKEVMMMKNIRASFNYLIRRLGTNEGMPEDSVRKFMKLWWYNSRDTLERFITCCEETVETEEMIMDDMMDLYYTPGNLEIARDTFDKLEIASIMNEILYTVDQYVEETEILFRGASTAADRQAFAVMSIWEWNELKHGYPEWREPAAVSSEDPELISSESSCLSESDDPSVHSSQVSCGEESEELPESPEKSPIKIPRRISELDENDESRRNSLRKGSPNKQMMKYYSEVYESLKAVEAQRRDKKAEEAARRCMDRWEVIEREQRWEIEDKERKIHDYLMMEQAVMEKFGEEQEKKENLKNWKEILKNPEAESTQLEDCMMYGRSGIPTAEVLEMMGIPLSLDRDMFYMEMYECQSAATSVSDADELRELIEKDFKEEDLEIDGTDMDDDAVSYSSVKHVFKHELYFQRDLESRRVPSGILIFTPEQFFEDELDSKLEYEKWRRIIEASECPFTFNTLVMRERLLGKCREAFKQYLLDRYLYPEEHRNSVVLEIFKNCFVIVVVDTHLEPWDCRVVSRDDVTKAVADRASWLRQWMVQDSQERMIQWMTSHKIDMEVYASCPVLSVRGGDLTHEHIEQMSRMFIEESTREEWLSIKRHEGVQALDTIIRMPPPPSSKINAYKLIFKPIYDAWYHLWKFENQQSNSKTIIARKFDPVKEYLHKARMIVNYAHQHYRMKRFDSLMSKDPTEFQLVDRSDVPSASLFDSLDAAVSKFCNEDSPHLAEDQKQVVKDTLIQLATGKIPYFTTNYFGGYDYTENISLTEEDEENDDDKSPVLRNTDIVQPAAPNAKYLEMEDCEEEIEWLRSMHEGSDFHRRRFMAVLMYKMAQKAIFRFAPHLADFERGRKRFQHLLTLHAKQRPLLDMMITKVRGTYFMPLETNMFLYDSKLITFAELVDSEVHPKEWKERKETFEEIRRQTPKDPKSMSRFLNMHNSGSDSDSGSEVRSDSSSSLGGSTESLNSSKKGKRARRAMNKAQRELMLLKLRSKPVNPEETFALEKRAIGAKKWKVRRKINEMLEGIADLDKFKIEAKLPAKKKDLLKHINELIVENSDTAHWSWGDLKMQTRIRKIPPANRMKPKHINRILKGKKMYKPPKKYDPKDAQTNGRKWF